MNIGLLIGQFPPGVVGGAEFQAEAWATRLAVRHGVTVVTRANARAAAGVTVRDGFTVRRLAVSGVPFWRTVRDLTAIRTAVGALAPRPDVLLCFQTFISGLAGVLAQSRFGIPAVVWVRGEDELRLSGGNSARWINPHVWSAARGVLVQSEGVREGLLARLRAADPGGAERLAARIAIVPNGIDLPPAAFAPGHGVLSVGRLIRDKGMDLVIDACRAAGLPLTIAGDGPERAALEAHARAAGGGVTFAGAVSRDRLTRLYREAGMVVLASRRGEGFPNVVLESMAHARPVIAARVLGVPDLVRDGGNGILVPPGDPAALAAALGRIATDPGLACRIGRSARETAEAFSWPQVLPRLEHRLEQWSGS